MTQNRDFYAGLVATAFFAFVLFVLIPVYVKVPSFIPGFAPPPDMWPRVVAVIGLVMGILAVIPAFMNRRHPGGPPLTGLLTGLLTGPGGHIRRNKVLIGRFIALMGLFAAFVYGMPVIGFVSATVLLLAALFVMTGDFTRKFPMIGLALAFPVLLYLLFTEVTHTPVPESMLLSGHLTGPLSAAFPAS